MEVTIMKEEITNIFFPIESIPSNTLNLNKNYFTL